MTAQISWMVELAVVPGMMNEFLALTAAMVAAAREEAGVKAYQRFLAEPENTIIVYERYADSAAALSHLRMFEQRFAKDYSRLAIRKSFTVFGIPGEELRGELQRYGAEFLRPFSSLPYWSD